MKSQAVKSVTEPDPIDQKIEKLEAAFRAARKLKTLRATLELEDETAKRQRDSLLLQINAASIDYEKAAKALSVQS